MSTPGNTLEDLVEILKRQAPQTLDLLTARSEMEFEQAFSALLEQAVNHLETNKKSYRDLDEEGLSSVIAARLSMPGLGVSQETHSNGHVDITVQLECVSPMRRKLCEAKIYKGYAYHVGGLDQLLSRYTTGREGRGLLIIYVRKANIAGLIKELRIQMDSKRPCVQRGDTLDCLLKWSFLSTHAHACGEDVEVGHIGCNLFVE